MKQHVLTLTPNPCLDETIWMDGETELYRTYQSGGKGLNVARVLKMLGVPVIAMAPLKGDTGEYVKEIVKGKGVDLRVLPVQDDTRKVITTVQKESYEQKQEFRPGAMLSSENIKEIYQTVKDELESCCLLLLSGRLPENSLTSGDNLRNNMLGLYPSLIKLAQRVGVPVWLDTHGPGFLEAFYARPNFMKPNIREASQLSGMLQNTLRGQPNLRDLPRDICSRVDYNWVKGNFPILTPLIEFNKDIILMVTLGSQGVFCWQQGKGVFYPPYKVETINPVGSGDSFIAGWVYGWLKGAKNDECMRLGQAAGAVNASMWEVADFTKQDLINLDPSLAPLL